MTAETDPMSLPLTRMLLLAPLALLAIFSAGRSLLARLGGPSRTARRPWSLPDWRPEATALLKSRGIDYILFVNESDHPHAALFADLLARRQQWGLREVPWC